MNKRKKTVVFNAYSSQSAGQIRPYSPAKKLRERLWGCLLSMVPSFRSCLPLASAGSSRAACYHVVIDPGVRT